MSMVEAGVAAARVEALPEGPTGGGCQEAVEDVMLSELHDRQRRARNVMLFNVPESDAATAEERRACDLEFFNKLLEFLGLTALISNMFRLGKFNRDKNRPIKVILESDRDCLKILSNSKKLRGKPEYANVYLASDLTPRQLSRYKVVRAELRDRSARGESNLKIRFVRGTPKIVTLN